MFPATCLNPSCRHTFSAKGSDSVLCPKCNGTAIVRTSSVATFEPPPEAGLGSTSTVDSPVSQETVDLPSQPMIGRFQVRTKLGEGAFGEVYRAHDPQLDREVAVKVAKPGTLDSPERIGRFLREARAAANLRHPHIVPVHDSGHDGDRHYIATGFIDGRTLEAEIDDADGKPLDLKRAASVVRKLAEALGYAHQQGVVHRDVKPANVLVDRAGEPSLTDFGLAVRAGDEAVKTQDGRVMGTPAYMSPEQAAGRSADATAASDQYALGVMLYELAVGHRPFVGAMDVVIFQQIQVQPKRPRAVNRAIPKDLETVILKCLEKEPAKRYASCEALADDLRRFLDDEPVTARRIGPLERTVRWAKRNPVVAGSLAFGVLALTVGMGVSLWQRDEALKSGQAANLARTNEASQSTARQIADANRLAESDARALQFQMSLYSKCLDDVVRAMKQDELNEVESLLASCPPELRGPEWNYLSESAALTGTLVVKPQEGEGEVEAEFGRRQLVLCGDENLFAARTRIGDRKLVVQFLARQTQSREVEFERTSYTFDQGQRARVTHRVKSAAWQNVALGATIESPLSSATDDWRLALSSGGKVFAVASAARKLERSEDGPVKEPPPLALTVRDVGTEWDSTRSLGTIPNHRRTTLAFSPSGSILAATCPTESGTGELRLWEMATGKAMKPLEGIIGPVAFRPDGSGFAAIALPKNSEKLIAASLGWQYALALWDLPSCERRTELELDRDVWIDPETCRLIISPDGKWVFGTYSTIPAPGGRGEHRFSVWDAETGKLSGRQPELPGGGTIEGVTLTSAIVVKNEVAYVFDIATRKIVRNLRGHNTPLIGATADTVGETVMTFAIDGSIRRWSLGEAYPGSIRNTYGGAGFNSQGTKKVSIQLADAFPNPTAKNQAVLTDLDSNKMLWEVEVEQGFRNATWSRSGSHVALTDTRIVGGGPDSPTPRAFATTLAIWEASAGATPVIHELPAFQVLAIDPARNQFAVLADSIPAVNTLTPDQPLRITQALSATRSPIRLLQIPGPSMAEFSPDGTMLVAGAVIYAAEDGRVVGRLTNPVAEIGFDMNGKWILSRAGTPKAWSISGLEVTDAEDRVKAFGRERVLIRGRTGVEVYDVRTGQRVVALPGIMSAAENSNGRGWTLVSNEGAVRSWESVR